MEKIWTLWAYEIFTNAEKKLEAHRKPWYTLIVHPSVIAYDYRIAWTWEEMDKRNKSNILTDELRHACWLPLRPYWDWLVSQWTSHWGKDRWLVFKNWKKRINDWR